jgi:hypothetical protein
MIEPPFNSSASVTALASLFVTSKVNKPAAALDGDGAQPSDVSLTEIFVAEPLAGELDDEEQPLMTTTTAMALTPRAAARCRRARAAIMTKFLSARVFVRSTKRRMRARIVGFRTAG